MNAPNNSLPIEEVITKTETRDQENKRWEAMAIYLEARVAHRAGVEIQAREVIATTR